ncbi:hypothetical protein E2I00_001646 [Balaenoptera physalus]|uniref:Phenylalanine--tRNA ligase alpha subunit n=1 Tax=Balaenoptera physalus TaxID=9770 RepID=A0A6A1QES4_BALPH|nr:hypothetical protein E2I00_001646 [Balaenoptera physalus]
MTLHAPPAPVPVPVPVVVSAGRHTPSALGAVMADGPVAEVLLQRLEAADGGLDSGELAAELGVEHQTVVGAVKSLQALGEIIEAELRSTKRWELTAEGEEIAREGSHEARRLPSGKVGFSKAMSNKWIRVDKSAADGPRVFRVVDSVEDEVQRRLQLVQGGQAEKLGEKERSELRKRKLLTEVTLKTYWVSKGSAFSTSISKQETELSPEMISSGSWRDRPFKPYNFSAHGVLPDSGHLHPLLKVRTQFRQIFLEMGFTEMPTDNYIESSFWNFDALFQPQQHPARDQHDTFFLRDPAQAQQLPMDYVHRVKRTHSQGGYGSQGYKYNWKLDEARKNLLRTHTTSASARALYRLAQKKPFTAAKYFSIDPNCQAQYHPHKPPHPSPAFTGLKKWVEVGNSGIFRPEMLLPMGLPENVSVIAWGLSLERPTMIKYGINNIRELVGHKVNLQMVYDSPLCRLDAERGPPSLLGEGNRTPYPCGRGIGEGEAKAGVGAPGASIPTNWEPALLI